MTNPSRLAPWVITVRCRLVPTGVSTGVALPGPSNNPSGSIPDKSPPWLPAACMRVAVNPEFRGLAFRGFAHSHKTVLHDQVNHVSYSDMP